MLRDRLPTTIDALEARRAHFDDIFHQLWRAGVQRHDLQLAFDFVVRSEKQLHERMLIMRNDALDWLDALDPSDVSGLKNAMGVPGELDVEEFGDCSDPDQEIWRRASGTFDGRSRPSFSRAGRSSTSATGSATPSRRMNCRRTTATRSRHSSAQRRRVSHSSLRAGIRYILAFLSRGPEGNES